jgi:hypothetical protein
MDRDPRDLASELVVCLKRQAEGLNQFLDLLARQQAALVSRNPREVDRITSELEQVVTQSQRLESTRKSLTARLVAGLSSRAASGDPQQVPDPATLAELSGLVAASEASELAAVQARLRGLHKEIDRRRRLNAALIEESLRCTGETLQWIAKSCQREPTYSQPGGKTPSRSQLAVNRRC